MGGLVVHTQDLVHILVRHLMPQDFQYDRPRMLRHQTHRETECALFSLPAA